MILRPQEARFHGTVLDPMQNVCWSYLDPCTFKMSCVGSLGPLDDPGSGESHSREQGHGGRDHVHTSACLASRTGRRGPAGGRGRGGVHVGRAQ